MLGTILSVLVILMIFGNLPTWPHTQSRGHTPSGGWGRLLVLLVPLVLTGRI
jgi:hypothetical protein